MIQHSPEFPITYNISPNRNMLPESLAYVVCFISIISTGVRNIYKKEQQMYNHRCINSANYDDDSCIYTQVLARKRTLCLKLCLMLVGIGS